MTDILRILLVEDNEADAVLLLRELENGGFQFQRQRVETRESLVSALEAQDWDITISESVLPGFSGMDALKMVKELKPDLPFIMISAKMDEGNVIETLKAGAQDYVMKDRLFRLCPAVEHALQYQDFYIEKKEAEIELQKVVSRYHLLAENITDIIWTTDLERKFTFVSPSITHVLGYRIEDLIGTKLDDLLLPRGSRMIDRMIKNLVVPSEGQDKNSIGIKDTLDMEVRRKNGQPFWMETKVVILSGARGRPSGILGVSRNVTDRKEKEKEIALLALAFKQLGEGVVITDEKGIIQYVNESFKKHSGFSRQKFIGKSLKTLDSRSDTNHHHRDFSYALLKRKPWKGQLRRQKKDGSFYHADISLYPVNDEDHKIINFVYIERDITQELMLQAKLIEMQKMEALGTLAGGIAHDFNNILMPIIVNSEMLLWDSGRDDPQNVYIDQILEAAKRGKELVKQIISYSRRSSVEKKTIDIVPLIKESVSFLHASLPSTIKIDPEFKVDKAPIEGNPTQIHQVLMNLFTNAADAMDGEGRIKITLEQTDFNDEEMFHDVRLGVCPCVRVSISDSGPGIAPDIMEKIFDPFFSTKDPGKGVGMGLSVARRIVHDHGGTITVDKEPDKGATFHVHLPLSEERLPAIDEQAGALEGGGEHILLVDDEIPVVESIQNMLRKLGYTVTGVTSGEEALDIINARSDAVDLVVTDQTMPGLTGDQLSREIERIRPDLPLILMTGFSESISPEESENLGIDAFVMKPVSTKTMAATIRRVLDRKK